MHAQGFVLLEENAFDPQDFLALFEEDWGITPEIQAHESEEGDESDILSFTVDGLSCYIAPMPAPVPDQEAEQNAQFNWMWEEAVEVTSQHQAHLLVVVMGGDDAVERMRLYSKMVASCLALDEALGVYTSGTVFEPNFYREVASSMNEGEMPIPVWVFVGLYADEKGSNAYTIGMSQFGKEEMEILGSRAEVIEVFATLSQMAAYVIEYDAVLQDGETIGFSEEQKLAITRSKAEAGLAEFTLKIDF